ncbi:DUF4335 domain-containing protein [Pleurocapsales cyanobacterium LEGE 06147]|nr:DUF4335 domain-containing protein [Pleurocapsales cyanobacterium LEGE 06147]
MTIRRQYSLPNCTLVLEGLSETADEENEASSGQQPMSILVNAECHFTGSNQILSGGRVFFENLVKTVSAYAQEMLSGLAHPQESHNDSMVIRIETLAAENLHRLTLESEKNSGKDKTVIELNTVELFDLVEAIDQFFADSSTLPDLNLTLAPVSKRYRQPEEPLVDRVTPAALGITSLALAAAAFLVIPPPQVREPEPKETSPTQTVPPNQESQPPGASPNPTNSPSP